VPKASVYNVQGEVVGEVELSDAVFGAEINEVVMHQAVVAFRARQRQGTQSTKGRSEVSGGGKKPWRQKGTGLARAGSNRSPLWRGGGVTFGPKPRDFAVDLPKMVRRKALTSALSAKVKEGDLLVVEGLHFQDPKTKAMVELLGRLNVGDTALIVTRETDPAVMLSARNLPGVDTERAENLNAYVILAHGKLLMTREAVAKVEEVFGA